MKQKNPISTGDEDRGLNERYGRGFPFTVPENYFEDLPTLIQEKLPAVSGRKQRQVLFPKWKLIPVASLLAIGFLFFYNPFRNAMHTTDARQQSGDLSFNPENYSPYLLFQFTEDLYLSSLSPHETAYADSVIMAKAFFPEGALSDDEIIDYLIYHQSAYTLLSQ